MTARKFIRFSVIVLLLLEQAVLAQGVLSTNAADVTNLIAPGPFGYPLPDGASTNDAEMGAATRPFAPELEKSVSSPAEFPGPPQQHIEHPSVSGLRVAIMALAAVVIVPCLLGACVMIAKEHRRAARICIVAAAIVGAACLLALIVVDSLD